MTDVLVKVLLIMAVMLLFIVPGFVLRKTNLIRPEVMPTLSNILLYYAQPMLIIKAFAVDPIQPTGQTLLNFLYVILFAFAVILLTFAASRLAFRHMKGPDERNARDVLVFSSTFSNCAFVGIPFIDMYSDGNAEAMMYIIVFNIVINLLIWTLGAYLVTQDKKQMSVKKAILNPCTVGSAIGLILFCFPQINVFNMEAVEELQQIVVASASMTAPLAMLLVGVRIADLSPKRLFADKNVYLATAMRLIVSAAITYLVILPFKLTGVFARNELVLMTPLIAMSMPPATSVVAFAEKFGREQELAAAAYATGNLFALVTLPVILLFISL